MELYSLRTTEIAQDFGLSRKIQENLNKIPIEEDGYVGVSFIFYIVIIIIFLLYFVNDVSKWTAVNIMSVLWIAVLCKLVW